MYLGGNCSTKTRFTLYALRLTLEENEHGFSDRGMYLGGTAALKSALRFTLYALRLRKMSTALATEVCTSAAKAGSVYERLLQG
jgi:ribosomal protein L30/L7E